MMLDTRAQLEIKKFCCVTATFMTTKLCKAIINRSTSPYKILAQIYEIE